MKLAEVFSTLASEDHEQARAFILYLVQLTAYSAVASAGLVYLTKELP